MADQKISELNAITGANTADDDLFVIVDTSTNETKKISKSELVSTVNAALIDGAPATLDTLNELAAALADDANFATTVTNSLAGKVDTTGDTMTGDLNFGDNDKAIFGAGSDLQIYHDGSSSYVKDAGTGSLSLQTNGTQINLYDTANSQMLASFINGGANNFYNNGALKLATTSTGIDVTGTATMDGLTVDGSGTFQSTSGQSLTLKSTNGSATTGDLLGELLFVGSDGSTPGGGTKAKIRSEVVSSVGDDANLMFSTSDGTTNDIERMLIANNGDISFYEDTGTTAKFFWDASAERLGIGTTTPDANGLTIDTAGGEMIHLISGHTSKAYIEAEATSGSMWRLGTVDSNDEVRLEAMSATGEVKFLINSSEKARIDSSGNLLVGTTSALSTANDSTTNGLTFYNSGVLFASRANGGHYFNRNSSDGDIAVFRKDGSTVGSIGSNGGDAYIGTGDTGIRFADGIDCLIPFNTSAMIDRNATIDIGYPTQRFKDLYLSGGVYLGGTGSANHLDDYEEGTWTPTLYSGTNLLTTTEVGTYTSFTYTKVGNRVTIGFKIDGETITGTSGGTFQIRNLPYVVSSSHRSASSRIFFYSSGLRLSQANVFAHPNQGSTTMNAYYKDVATNAYASVNADVQSGSTYFFFEMTYQTDA